MLVRDDECHLVETPTGKMGVRLVRPRAPGRYPAILFFSEIFQITPPILRLAAELAGHGYLVAVPEVYHEFLPPWTVLGYDDEGKKLGNSLKTRKPLAWFDSDVESLMTWLKIRPFCAPFFGAAGVCLGGHLAFRAALQPRVLASACFFPTDIHSRSLGEGASDDSLSRVHEIAGEVLLVFGRQDPHIPAAGRRTIYDTLTAAGTNFTWHEFNAAHAFMRDGDPRFDAVATRLAKDLLLDVFSRRLCDAGMFSARAEPE